MTVELVRETLRTNHTIVQDEIQVIVEVNGIVPDTKGDVLRILSVDALPSITSTEVQKDKVVVEGTVRFKALYLCAEGQSPVDHIEVTATFKENLPAKGVKERMAASLISQVEHVDYVIENSRKMRFRAAAVLKVEVVDTVNVDIVRDVMGLDNVQLLKNSLRYTELVGDNSSQTVVRETVEIDEEELEIQEILRVDGKVSATEVKLVENKVIVSAIANLNILYWGNSEELKINKISHQIPFTHFVDIPGVYGDMESEVEFEIEELLTEIKENIIGEKRILDVEAVINVKAKASESHEIEVITDAYCPGKSIDIATSQVNMTSVVEKLSSKVSVKDKIETELNTLPIDKIYSVDANAVISECRIVEDKCIVEGVATVHVLYTTQDQNHPILNLKGDIPFRHFVEIPYDPNINVKAKAQVSNVECNVASRDEIDVTFDVDVESTILQQNNMDVVTKMVEKEGSFPLGPKSSLVIYVVQPDDTLWNIAKKYNTTIDDIIASNEIEDVDGIMPGEQILIQKTIKYSMK